MKTLVGAFNQEKALVGAFSVENVWSSTHYCHNTKHVTQATNNVEDYRHSTHLLGATTLRNVLGTKYLAEILSERSAVASSQSMSNCQSSSQ